MRLPKVVRAAGSALVGRVPVPILSGPNAGRLWTLASSGRGYVSGRFEGDRVSSILALLRAGDCVWDVGAHKGYISLAAARRVGAGGRVIAFEPARENLLFLRRHVAWNRAANVRVMDVALADAPGRAAFGGSGSTVTYRLGVGDEEVRVRTLAGLVGEDDLPAPTVLKLDVEGAEAAVLEGAGEGLRRIELIFVAVHDRPAYEDCREILGSAGFRVLESRKMRGFTETGSPWGGDADLVAWRPGRGLTAATVEALPAYR